MFGVWDVGCLGSGAFGVFGMFGMFGMFGVFGVFGPWGVLGCVRSRVQVFGVWVVQGPGCFDSWGLGCLGSGL